MIERMKDIATYWVRRQSQQLTLALVFLSLGAPFAPTKSSQKDNMNALKWVLKNESVVMNEAPSQTQELALTLVHFQYRA